MVDEPLILAILADYSPDSFYEALPSVQDDLEMLQASAVPDSDLSQDPAIAVVMMRLSPVEVWSPPISRFPDRVQRNGQEGES